MQRKGGRYGNVSRYVFPPPMPPLSLTPFFHCPFCYPAAPSTKSPTLLVLPSPCNSTLLNECGLKHSPTDMNIHIKGGHLAFRAAFDKRVAATVCYFATDIHSHTLGEGKKDDSLDRAGEIQGEVIMVRFLQSYHDPYELP